MDMIEELIPQGNDRIVCVKVSKVLRENLYEMTRKYWVMKLERASKATHVLAIVDGVVKAVYIPEKWYHSKDKGKEHRLEFIGKEDHVVGTVVAAGETTGVVGGVSHHLLART